MYTLTTEQKYDLARQIHQMSSGLYTQRLFLDLLYQLLEDVPGFELAVEDDMLVQEILILCQRFVDCDHQVSIR